MNYFKSSAQPNKQANKPKQPEQASHSIPIPKLRRRTLPKHPGSSPSHQVISHQSSPSITIHHHYSLIHSTHHTPASNRSRYLSRQKKHSSPVHRQSNIDHRTSQHPHTDTTHHLLLRTSYLQQAFVPGHPHHPHLPALYHTISRTWAPVCASSSGSTAFLGVSACGDAPSLHRRQSPLLSSLPTLVSRVPRCSPDRLDKVLTDQRLLHRPVRPGQLIKASHPVILPLLPQP